MFLLESSIFEQFRVSLCLPSVLILSSLKLYFFYLWNNFYSLTFRILVSHIDISGVQFFKEVLDMFLSIILVIKVRLSKNNAFSQLFVNEVHFVIVINIPLFVKILVLFLRYWFSTVSFAIKLCKISSHLQSRFLEFVYESQSIKILLVKIVDEYTLYKNNLYSNCICYLFEPCYLFWYKFFPRC